MVYKIECNNCNATYIGETKRKLSTRIKEHEQNLRKLDKQYVINEHSHLHGHTFNFKDTKILDLESNWHKRILSEMLHINLQDKPINKKEDTQNLQNIYIPILNELKRRRKQY